MQAVGVVQTLRWEIYVLDAAVMLKWFFGSVDHNKVCMLLGRHHRAESFIRIPITAIYEFADIAQRTYSYKSAAEIRDYAQEIYSYNLSVEEIFPHQLEKIIIDARQAKTSVQDAIYVWMAANCNGVLVVADTNRYQIFQRFLGVKVIMLNDLT